MTVLLRRTAAGRSAEDTYAEAENKGSGTIVMYATNGSAIIAVYK